MASGAGAAAIATLNLLVSMGAQRKNIWVCDIDGLVHEGRNTTMDRWKAVYAQKTDKRTLADVIGGADIFIGLSAPGVLKPEMAKAMGDKPLIMALANPTPEIMPEEARKVRPDAMICTGRSDYPNQVNNVLCFPFIFRGALDVGASAINEEMKHAAVEAIAQLAREAPSDAVAQGFDTGETQGFGPGSLIPSPFDPRLILRIAPAVAKAAMESGVATRPITNFDEYTALLERFAFRSGLVMKPMFAKAKTQPVRVIYAEGEDERVLRATQVVLEEKLATPILVGRPSVVEARIERFGLSIKAGKDFDLVNPEDDPRYRSYVQSYVEVAGRRGVTPDAARTVVRTNNTVIAALAVVRGEADAMLCGVEGRYMSHLRHVREIVGFTPGISDYAALALLITSKGAFFIADTQVRPNPSAEELAEIASLAAVHVQRFNIKPKIAFVSHSDFGSYDTGILAQDAPGDPAPEGEASGDRGRRRDAGRHRAFGRCAQNGAAALQSRGRGQHHDHAKPRHRQRRLSDDQVAGGRAARRSDPDRPGAPGPHPHPVGDGARHPQHDRGGCGGSAGARVAAAADVVYVGCTWLFPLPLWERVARGVSGETGEGSSSASPTHQSRG